MPSTFCSRRICGICAYWRPPVPNSRQVRAGTFYIEFPPSDTFMPPRRNPRDPQNLRPYSFPRFPQRNISVDSPGCDTRAYFLSLPTSLIESEGDHTPRPEANMAYAEGRAPSSPGDESGAGGSRHQEDTWASSQRGRLQSTADVEAYTIPEKYSANKKDVGSLPRNPSSTTRSLSGQQENKAPPGSSSVNATVAFSLINLSSAARKSSGTRSMDNCAHCKELRLGIVRRTEIHKAAECPYNYEWSRSRTPATIEEDRPRVSWHDMASDKPSSNSQARCQATTP